MSPVALECVLLVDLGAVGSLLRRDAGATRFLWGRMAKGPSLGLPKPRLTTMQVFEGEAGHDE